MKLCKFAAPDMIPDVTHKSYNAKTVQTIHNRCLESYGNGSLLLTDTRTDNRSACKDPWTRFPAFHIRSAVSKITACGCLHRSGNRIRNVMCSACHHIVSCYWCFRISVRRSGRCISCRDSFCRSRYAHFKKDTC